MNKYESAAKSVISNFSYDIKSGLLIWKTGRHSGKAAGTKSKDGYVEVRLRGKRIPVHRIVWFSHRGSWPTGLVDHINGLRGDNRIENLRVASHQHNTQNRRCAAKNNALGLLGVSRLKVDRARPYVARIFANNTRFHLGGYATPEEAQAAYVKAKRILHAGNTL